MIKCALPVPTCLVLLGVSVELEQSIRDGGKGAPQTTHRTLVNGDWRGRVGEGSTTLARVCKRLVNASVGRERTLRAIYSRDDIKGSITSLCDLISK